MIIFGGYVQENFLYTASMLGHGYKRTLTWLGEEVHKIPFYVVFFGSCLSFIIKLDCLLRQSSIPHVVCVSVGVLGLLHISSDEHLVIESHPDTFLPDLRLDQPLIELVKMNSKIDLNKLGSNDLAHLPWLIIIHNYVQLYVQQHDGQFPSDYKAKSEVVQMIRKASSHLVQHLRAREPDLDPSFRLDNFEEACNAVNTAVNRTEIPPHVLEILDDPRSFGGQVIDKPPSPCAATNAQPVLVAFRRLAGSTDAGELARPFRQSKSTKNFNSKFWRLAQALRDFVFEEGKCQLPVRGSLPDMISHPSSYLELLGAYRQASQWAVDRVAARLDDSMMNPEITRDEVQIFVKNAAFLRLIRGQRFTDLMQSAPSIPSQPDFSPDVDAVCWFLTLRAALRFKSDNKRWPGELDSFSRRERDDDAKSSIDSCPSIPLKMSKLGDALDHLDVDQDDTSEDVKLLNEALNELLEMIGLDDSWLATSGRLKDYTKEFMRFGGRELHTVSAFMGGVAAQEVIKMLTHQYVPIDKPLLYNAINQSVTSLS